MLSVRDDDAPAFEELMLRYQNRLGSLLTHMVGQHDLAEDLAQEVFLRVYRGERDMCRVRSFRRGCLQSPATSRPNALRSRARRHEVNLSSSPNDSQALPMEAAAPAASGLMPTRQLDKAELRDVVRQAIETLNDRQRMAVLLSKFEHFNYAEIAEIMDLSPEAVKSLLSRARCHLRDVLEPYLECGTRIDV